MTQSPPDRPIRLTIFSSPTHLVVVRGAVDGLCRSIGFDDDSIAGVVMSVDEALSNVIRHAYDNAEDQPIDIELAWTEAPDGVWISVRDRGRYVGPECLRPPARDELQPGGLGLHIMTECMDQLEYRPAEGGGTVLTMVKQLEQARGRS
jgi:anti-sigma regulatory factor (Ser/Thr protein kinase)